MNEKLIELFNDDFRNTIEGLIGIKPDIKLEKINKNNFNEIVNDLNKFDKYSLINFNIADEKQLYFNNIIIPDKQCSLLCDLMLAGDGDENNELNDEMLECIKEIIHNVLGSFNTGVETNLNKDIDASITSVKSIDVSDAIDHIDNGTHLITFKILNYQYSLLLNLNIKDNSNITTIDQNPLKNIKLNLQVKIFDKLISINDLEKLNVDEKIFSNKKCNELLEISIQNVTIAYGEAVIVDGKFGIQIVEILETFKGLFYE